MEKTYQQSEGFRKKTVFTPDLFYFKRFQVAIDDRTLLDEAKETQTIIHCNYVAKEMYINGGWVNIYPQTFLETPESRKCLPMLHACNIPYAPSKHYFQKAGQLKRFTLFFEGLPKEWKQFNLVEYTESGKGFVVNDIYKNDSGVYNVFLQ